MNDKTADDAVAPKRSHKTGRFPPSKSSTPRTVALPSYIRQHMTGAVEKLQPGRLRARELPPGLLLCGSAIGTETLFPR